MLVVLICAVSCATFSPRPGMTFSDVASMSKKAKSGELIHTGSEGPYETYVTSKGRTDFYGATAEERKTLYFSKGTLRAEGEVIRYRDEQREIARAEEDRKRVEEELKKKQEADRIERELLEKCLSNGPVGLCLFHDDSRFFRRLIEKSINDYTLDSDLNQVLGEINFMATRQEMNETTGLSLRLRNNEPYEVHDIELTCMNIAESGTVLGSYRRVYFISMQPGDVRNLDLVVPDREQQVKITCSVTKYSNSLS